MATYPVPIQPDGILLGPDKTRPLSKERQDQVQWIAAGSGGRWTVVFRDGTPFTASRFEVSVGKPTNSGPAVGNVGDRYKYDIEDAEGNITEDPEIIIDA